MQTRGLKFESPLRLIKLCVWEILYLFSLDYSLYSLTDLLKPPLARIASVNPTFCPSLNLFDELAQPMERKRDGRRESNGEKARWREREMGALKLGMKWCKKEEWERRHGSFKRPFELPTYHQINKKLKLWNWVFLKGICWKWMHGSFKNPLNFRLTIK